MQSNFVESYVLKLITRHRQGLLAILLLVLPFGTFIAQARQARSVAWYDRFLVGATQPIQAVVDGGVFAVIDAWQEIASLRSVRRENERLRREILALRRDAQALEEAGRENVRLRRLLDLADPVVGEGLAARVVSIGSSTFFRTIRLDKGTEDGVAVGMPVVTPEGVVGRVHQVYSSACDVLLLVDGNSAISALVARSRARAIARGTGTDDEGHLDYLLRTEDVEIGDIVVTSGSGGMFPKGLPLGRVTAVQKKSYGLYQEATVVPAVDFARLEEVVLLPAPATEGPDLSLSR